MRPEGHDIQAELMDIQRNAKETSEESFWASVTTLYSRGHYKQAMAALFIPFFQQFTGMNAIMFYGALVPSLPILFLPAVEGSLHERVQDHVPRWAAIFLPIFLADPKLDARGSLQASGMQCLGHLQLLLL